jgi:hypothetical protein
MHPAAVLLPVVVEVANRLQVESGTVLQLADECLAGVSAAHDEQAAGGY